MQMVYFMADKASDVTFEYSDTAGPVDVLVLDMDGEGARDPAAYVEEAPASLVLLVGLGGFLDYVGVEQGEHLAVGCTNHSGGPANADLWGGYAHALGEMVDAGRAFDG